jgi:hypothetical protein
MNRLPGMTDGPRPVASRAALVLVLLVFHRGPIAAQDGQVKEPGPPAGSDLALADLAPYRSALDGKPGGPAVPVAFRDLWNRPHQYQGQRVRVEGRVVRRFRQGAFATFPPLVEAWAVSPAGDPFCLVFPDPAAGARGSTVDLAGPGASVRFEGVFLRQVRYPGGDAARRAPLVVGDRAPTVTTTAPRPAAEPPQGRAGSGAWGGFSRFDWALGLGAALVAGWVLAFQHLRRPPRRPHPFESDLEPPPEFVDPA